MLRVKIDCILGLDTLTQSFYFVEVDMKFLNTALLLGCLCGSSFSHDDQRASSSSDSGQREVQPVVQFNMQEYNDLLYHLSGQNITYYDNRLFNYDDLERNFSIEEVAAVYHAMQRQPDLFERAPTGSIAYKNFSVFSNFLRDWEKNNGVKVADLISNNN